MAASALRRRLYIAKEDLKEPRRPFVWFVEQAV
jgi:hypothetical protein